MRAITEDELTLAIERTLVAQGRLPATDARSTAQLILSYFGSGDTVLDNMLSKEDRDRFYALEEAGLLASEEEDATVSRGRTWRIHYWLLQKDRVHAASAKGGDAPSGASTVYDSISQQEWDRASDREADSGPP